MRILHAADLHLDSALLGLARYEGAPVERIRLASRRAFEGLVDFCLHSEVQLLLLAGDLFDGDWRDYSTGLFFGSQLARLREVDCRVVFVRGNHDAQSRITRELRLPDNVRELAAKRPETVVFDELGVAVHGQSFARAAITEDLAASFPEPVAGALNVGLLHTSLNGRAGHEPYAPTTKQCLLDKGYDYWALGHVHTREVVHEAPFIVFPGNLQGRHARETGEKGATLLDVYGGRLRPPEALAFDVVRWAAIEVNAEACSHLDDVLERVEKDLAEALRDADGRMLAARVRVVGESPAHAELNGDVDRLRAEIQRLSLDLDELWVEKVVLETREQSAGGSSRERQDLMGRVEQGFERLGQSDELAHLLETEIAELRQKLPPELRSGSDALPLDDADALRRYLAQAKHLTLSRLLQR